MQPAIVVYRSFWGVWDFRPDTLAPAIDGTAERGFDGIETNPAVFRDGPAVLDRLDGLGLKLLPRLWTFGDSLDDHLGWVRRGIEASIPFAPPWIIVQGGQDHWPAARADEFLSACTAMEAEYGVTLAHETHRGRILYSPWIIGDVLDRHPTLHLAADYSHFAVVAERLLAADDPVLVRCAPKMLHLDARVGHPEAPQITDPRDPRWSDAVEAHFSWWQGIVDAATEAGRAQVTVVPEFGPEPYRVEGAPPSDEINVWMLGEVRRRLSAP